MLKWLRDIHQLHRTGPSALQIAVRDLETAQVVRLSHASDKEYHIAMESMLSKRILRLKEDIAVLNADPVDGSVNRQTMEGK